MKGFTNNIHGRPKGVPNKITSELRSMLNDFVTEQWETIKQDFGRLEPKDRLIYYERLLQYCLPKNSKLGLDSEEAKAEQPLFQTVLCYELDLEKVQYPDLKLMLEKSEVFMRTNQNATIRFEIPDNYRQYETE
jgi:hypothetical protein